MDVKRVVLFALAAGAIVRVVAAYFTVSVRPGDPQIYLTLAASLPDGLHRFAPTLGIEVWAIHPPLYPVALGLAGFAAPLNFWTVAAVNTAIDLCAVGAILRLGKVLSIEKPGAYSAAAYFLLCSLSAPIPQKEGLVAALFLALVCAAVERRAALLGLAGGLLALTQPGLALLPAAFALFFLPWRHWPIAAAATIVVMLPWWIRNLFVFEQFVPLTTASGYSLWIGALSDHRWTALPAQFLVGSELEISRIAKAAALAEISRDPVAFLAGSLVNALPKVLPFLAVAVLAKGALRAALLMSLAYAFAFQMWFEFGTRHLAHLIPISFLIVMTWLWGFGSNLEQIFLNQRAKGRMLGARQASAYERGPEA